MDVERRRGKRVSAPFTVKLSVGKTESGQKWEENTAKNVNAYGLAVTTTHDYSKNIIVTLLLRIPTQPTLDWMQASGKIVNCTRIMDNAYTTRIEFVDMNSALKEAVGRYVEWASKK